MKQRKRISQILIIVVLCILILYVGITEEQRKTRIFQGKHPEISGTIVNRAAKFYLSGFIYMEEWKGASPLQWLCESAGKLLPLGTYVAKAAPAETEIEDREMYEMLLAKQANDESTVDEKGNLIGKEKVPEEVKKVKKKTDISLAKLSDFEYLTSHFYTVDSSTFVNKEQLNAKKLLKKDMTLDTKTDGPKVLIYHTHSQEAFKDSKKGKESDTIMGMGAYLSKLLNDTYGIPTMHHKGVYDLIDGQMDRSKAYQLAEPEIQKILKDNPSIEVVIDLHRDGVGNSTHLITEINGKQTAQIMFFNGMSRSRKNGDISYLKNPYIEENLAFSLQMQLAATKMYPGFTRRIYLKSYRYNMHLKPKTLLVEAGAQTNTVEEMRNAMELLAGTLDSVLKS